jgi:hypothetical protein
VEQLIPPDSPKFREIAPGTAFEKDPREGFQAGFLVVVFIVLKEFNKVIRLKTEII